MEAARAGNSRSASDLAICTADSGMDGKRKRSRVQGSSSHV